MSKQSRGPAYEARNDKLREFYFDLDKARKIAPPTGQVLEKTAKDKLKLPWSSELLPHSLDARIHWVGDKSAKRVLYYLHGGGYGLGAFHGHLIFAQQCVEHLKKTRDEDVVIAFLEYSLTPQAKYPVQFQQAVEGLRFILSKGYRSEDVVMGGDSCGGQLAMAVLSIAKHGHDAVRPALNLSEPLAGVFVIGAWVTFDQSSTSYKENEKKDVHFPSGAKALADAFCTPGTSERNEFTEPLTAEVGWWKDLPVKKVLNIWGEYEMFDTDDRAFGDKLKQAGVNVTNIGCPLQVHVECILDTGEGLEVGSMGTETWKWLETVYQ